MNQTLLTQYFQCQSRHRSLPKSAAMPLLQNSHASLKDQAIPLAQDPALNTNTPVKASNSSFQVDSLESPLSAGATYPETNEVHNLLRSFGGLRLPAEICLKIVEKVVDIDPKNAPIVMCLSKVGSSFIRSIKINRLSSDP